MKTANTDFKKKLLKSENQNLKKLSNEYQEVFQDDLSAGLPPERAVNHEIEKEEGSKPPHRPLCQLSPMEMKAAKEYVEDLMQKGRIRPSKSPYGAPLFFVKEKNKPLRGITA